MPPTTIYAYFKPDALEASGYAYGEAVLPDRGSADVSVTRVASGRWAGLAAFEALRPRSEIERRAVSEAEAISGIGTFVGTCVCIARLPAQAAKSWDYGVVTGYSWDTRTTSGALHISFADTLETLAFNPDDLQDLSIATYALRPCQHLAVSDVMPAKMRLQHQAAFNRFTGEGIRATRNSTTILSKLRAPPIDETQRVPLFDVASGRVVPVSIKYILDFAYYREGGRRIPASLTVGESVFDEQQTAAPSHIRHSSNNVGVSSYAAGQLSDSEEDSGDEESPPVARTPAGAGDLQSRKRAREDDEQVEAEVEGADADISSLAALKDRFSSNPAMVRSINKVMALHQSALATGGISDMVAPDISSETKGEFRPSSMQRAIHRNLVNGTYAHMTPQLLVETLQVEFESSAFLPHPAILRGVYSWDFGLRGLSVMHFAPQSEQARRVQTSSSDMNDFTKKNSLPQAPLPRDLSALVEALDGLARLVDVVYLPYISELIMTARSFVLVLRAEEGFSESDSRAELVHWINVRLGHVRGYIAQGRMAEACKVKTEFDAANPSFLRVTQLILELRMRAYAHVPQAPTNHTGPPLTLASSGSSIQKGKGGQRSRPEVPVAVLKALPSQNGQSLCMKFLSNLQCPSRQKGCFSKNRGHFRPEALPPIVRAFIVKHYGGVRAEFADLQEPTGV